jgi:hypothetical protein
VGTLVVLIVLAVIGYYLYQQYFDSESAAPPSCKATLNSCIATCRRTTSEAPETQACQRRCMDDAQACGNSGSEP